MMRAFHNDAAIKAMYLARVQAHRAADEIAQGFYWQGGRGCAVGCTIHGDDHAAYERELGIPRMLARLEDRIFEGLPLAEAKNWPLRFLEAVPVGADLSRVGPQFLRALIQRRREQLPATAPDAVRVAMDRVLAVLTTWADTGEVDAHAAYDAADAADAAARAAADAARAADYSDAYAAARAAAHAADAAAYAAAYAADERRWQAATLVTILREAA